MKQCKEVAKSLNIIYNLYKVQYCMATQKQPQKVKITKKNEHNYIEKWDMIQQRHSVSKI